MEGNCREGQDSYQICGAIEEKEEEEEEEEGKKKKKKKKKKEEEEAKKKRVSELVVLSNPGFRGFMVTRQYVFHINGIYFI